MDFAALIYHRQAFLDGQWWLPLTAQLVHFNLQHALADGTGAVLLWCLFQPCLRWRQHLPALAGGALGVALMVVLDTGCDYYAGASGALHGWAAGGALLLLRLAPGSAVRPQGVAIALLGGIFLKMAWQAVGAANSLAWGFPVYQPAHVAGAVGGLVAAALVCARRGVPLPGSR